MQLIVMCGIPGAGKSTYVEKLREEGFEVICPDDIRAELTGDPSDQSQNAKVFEIAYSRLENATEKGFDVVFDATNVSVKARKEVLKHCNTGYTRIAVAVCTSLDEALRRNCKRERKVPEEVIRRMAANFSLPTEAEGFDKVILN